MKKILLVFLLAITLSCTSRKPIYPVFNTVFEQQLDYQFFGKKVEIQPNVNDTLLISNHAIPTKSLVDFSLDLESLNEKEPFYAGYKVYWADSLKKISFTPKEIQFLRDQMKETTFYFEGSKITAKDRIVIDYDSISKPSYHYNYESCKKEYIIYHFSKPCFTPKGDCALIGFYTSSSARKCCSSKMALLLLKKEGENWEVLGYQVDVGASH